MEKYSCFELLAEVLLNASRLFGPQYDFDGETFLGMEVCCQAVESLFYRFGGRECGQGHQGNCPLCDLPGRDGFVRQKWPLLRSPVKGQKIPGGKYKGRGRKSTVLVRKPVGKGALRKEGREGLTEKLGTGSIFLFPKSCKIW